MPTLDAETLNIVMADCARARGATPGTKTRPRALARRHFMRLATSGAFMLFGTGAYSFGIEPNCLVVERITLKIPGLAPRWHGKRIVQLTDLHACPNVDPRLISRAFEMAANLKPEMIVVTGDWVTDNCSRFGDLERAVTPILGKIPILGITGNHDFGAGANRPAIADELSRRLTRLGVRMLRNQAYQPYAGLGELCFIGLEDFWSPRFDPAAIALVPADAAVIVLSHNPDSYERLEKYRWQAMFSGHTHGGQVIFPGAGPIQVPIRHRERYAGLFKMGSPANPKYLYVSRGVGHWLHIRLFCPPEVTCFTLRGT